MSAAALFTPGAGDFHIPVTVRLKDLPRGERTAAWLVNTAILDFLRKGRTELGERYTDLVLSQSPWLRGYSLRFIQKGLRILERIGIISRRRAHGRRTIIIVGRLRGRPNVERKPKEGTKGKAEPKAIQSTNVVVIPATPEQAAATKASLDAEKEAARAREEEGAGLTAEDLAAAERLMERARQKREAAEAKDRPRPAVATGDVARGPSAPGMTAQAALEARRKAMGIRIAPEPKPLE